MYFLNFLHLFNRKVEREFDLSVHSLKSDKILTKSALKSCSGKRDFKFLPLFAYGQNNLPTFFKLDET